MRIRGGPVRSGEVHGADVDADGGSGLIVSNIIFFDGYQSIGFDGVGSGVGKGDASGAIAGSLNQIALVKRGAIIGFHPLHGINLLDLHASIKIHKFCLGVGKRPRLGISAGNGVGHLIEHGGVKTRGNQICGAKNQGDENQGIGDQLLVGHRVPIHLYPLDSLGASLVMRIVRWLYIHNGAQVCCANSKI